MIDDFPFKIIGKATASYEHSNKKKHLILEIRSDEFKVCTPKNIPTKKHWYSATKNWLVHRKKNDEWDIKLLD